MVGPVHDRKPLGSCQRLDGRTYLQMCGDGTTRDTSRPGRNSWFASQPSRNVFRDPLTQTPPHVAASAVTKKLIDYVLLGEDGKAILGRGNRNTTSGKKTNQPSNREIRKRVLETSFEGRGYPVTNERKLCT